MIEYLGSEVLDFQVLDGSLVALPQPVFEHTSEQFHCCAPSLNQRSHSHCPQILTGGVRAFTFNDSSNAKAIVLLSSWWFFLQSNWFQHISTGFCRYQSSFSLKYHEWSHYKTWLHTPVSCPGGRTAAFSSESASRAKSDTPDAQAHRLPFTKPAARPTTSTIVPLEVSATTTEVLCWKDCRPR